MTFFDHLRLLFDVYQNDLPDLINYLCTALKMEKGFFYKKKEVPRLIDHFHPPYHLSIWLLLKGRKKEK